MFEKLSKMFLLSFFTFALFLVVGLVKGFTADDPNLPKISTVEEYQQLQKRIHYLASDDEHRRSESIYYLKKFVHYFEVKESFLDVLLTELDRSTPNIRLIIVIVAAISPFLSSQDTTNLNQLRKRINRYKSLNLSPYFLEQMTAFIDRVISKNPEDINLYSLKGIQDSKVHHTLLTSRLYSLSSRSNSDEVNHIRSFRKGSLRFLTDELFFKGSYHSQVRQQEAHQVIDVLSQKGVNHIRSFRKGSLRFLTDDLFFKGSYHSQVRQQEAHQVIDVLSQKNDIPILIGLEESNKIIIRKVTQSVANMTPHDSRETYIIETTPSQINRVTENSSSNSSKAVSLEIYLEAILYIEEKLNIRIIVFMNKFHRLNASQTGVLHVYLQRERPIQLIAASTMQGYPTISQYLFNFREIIASRLSIKDLKNVMIEAIIPKLQQEHFNFHISTKAIYDIINYIYAHRAFQNELLIHVAEKLLIDLLVRKSQSIALNQNTKLYVKPIQITDEETRQFILSLQIPHQQQNTIHENCPQNLI